MLRVIVLGIIVKDTYHGFKYGIIHLVHAQNFPKNYFLPPDTHTYECVLGGMKH